MAESDAPGGFRAAIGVLAGVLGAIGVGFGAWAAHGAPAGDPADWAGTGSAYQVVHAALLAALALAPAAGRAGAGGRALRTGALATAIGAILFPGALYVLALGGPSWLGAVAPLGGLALIAGWLLFAAGMALSRR